MAAEAGRVMTHEKTISRSIPKLIAESPLARPTPKMEPTRQCVVEIGRPHLEATRIMVTAPNSAQKPLVGVSCVSFFPTVSMSPPPPRSKSNHNADAPHRQKRRRDLG